MRRVVAAALFLASLATQSQADTEVFGRILWVSGTGGSSTHTGADSLTHAYTLAQACASAVAGDTIKFNHSSFRSQTIAPAVSGNSQAAIVFMGDSLYPSTVVVGGINTNQFSANGKQFIRIIGVRCLNTSTQSYTSSPAGLINSNNVHVESCVFDSLTFLQGHLYGRGGEYSAVLRSRISLDILQMEAGETSTLFSGVNCGFGSGSDNTNTLDYDSLAYCAITLNNPSSGSTTIKLAAMDHLFLAGNRFTVNGGTSSAHGLWKMYGVQYSQFLDNWISLRDLNTDTACDECGTLYFRELTRYNNWQRDTILSLGPGWRQNHLSASGSCVGRVDQNTYNQCVWRDSATTSSSAAISWQNGSRGDQFTNNLVVSQTDFVASFATSYTAEYGTLIANNTFIGLGSGVRVSSNDFNATSLFRNNIFYATGAPAYVSGWTSPNGVLADTDYNLFWSTTGDSSAAVLRGSTTSSASTACTAGGNECHSSWADPLFSGVTSNALTFDAHLTPLSPARFAVSGIGYGGLDRGCYQFGGSIPPPMPTYRWVAPTARGGAFSAAGTDSSIPMTLKRANQSANSGFTFILLPGDYTADTENRDYLCGAGCSAATITGETGRGICPLADGVGADSLKAIRYMALWYYRASCLGASVAPDTGNYSVGNITIARKFVQVTGVSADSMIVRSGTSSGTQCPSVPGPSTWCYQATNDSLTWCKATRLLAQAASSVEISRCQFKNVRSAGATGPAAAQNYLLGAYAKLHGEAPGCMAVNLNDCTFQVAVNYNQAGISIGGRSQAIAFNRCTLIGDMQPTAVTGVPDTCVFLMLRNTTGLSMTDCHMKVNATAAETNPIYAADSLGVYALTMQDGFQSGIFTRDTLDLGLRSYNGAVIQIAARGGFQSSGVTAAVRNVYLRGCLVRGDYMFRQTAKLAQFSVGQSVFGSKRYAPMQVGREASTSDSIYFNQCTFYADSVAGSVARYRSQPALMVMLPNSKSVRVSRCLFYRAKVNQDADATSTPSGAIVQYGGIPTDASSFTSDNNLFYAVAGGDDTTRTNLLQTSAMYVSGWTSAGSIRDSVSLANTPIAPYLNPHTGSESRSLWGTPAFSDTKVDSTFSGALSCRYASGNAYRPWQGDSAVGGVQDDTPVPGVCTSPDTTASSPTSITVSFYGAANDSVLNRGTPGSYDIVFGTSPNIEDGAYAVHSVTGASPGSLVTAALGTGTDNPLANATIYYFAIYTRSRCGMRGPRSVVQCGVTRTAAGVTGGALCRDF